MGINGYNWWLSATPIYFFILFFFEREFIFKKTLFEKLQYLKQEE